MRELSTLTRNQLAISLNFCFDYNFAIASSPKPPSPTRAWRRGPICFDYNFAFASSPGPFSNRGLEVGKCGMLVFEKVLGDDSSGVNQRVAMGSLVAVACVDTGADERDFRGAARAPISGAV